MTNKPTKELISSLSYPILCVLEMDIRLLEDKETWLVLEIF